MCRSQVSKLYKLVPRKIGISISDHEMALSLIDPDAGRKLRSVYASGVYHNAGIDEIAIYEPDAIISYFAHGVSGLENGTARSSFIDEETRCSQLIDNMIAANKQPAGKTCVEVWFGFAQRPVRRGSRSQFRVSSKIHFSDGPRSFLRHRRPPRSFRSVHIRLMTAFRRPFASKAAVNIASVQTARFAVVHHDNMAHSGGGRAGRYSASVDQDNTKPGRRKRRSGCRANDACTDHCRVKCHADIP